MSNYTFHCVGNLKVFFLTDFIALNYYKVELPWLNYTYTSRQIMFDNLCQHWSSCFAERKRTPSQPTVHAKRATNNVTISYYFSKTEFTFKNLVHWDSDV